METHIQEISLILVNDYKIIENILLLADHFGVDESERKNLKVELRRGEVNYYDCIKTLLQGWVSRGGTRSLQDLLEIVNTMDCLNVAEILQDKFPPDALLSTAKAGSSTAKIKGLNRAWNVMNPVPHFVGREEEILQLHAFLENDSMRLLVVSGMGGQGKTQLCRKLVKDLQKNAGCSVVIWLAGESGGALTSSIINWIKKTTGINELKIKTLEEALELAISLVEDEQKVLWIIDNVDAEYNEIETIVKYFLTKMGNSKIIITSRLRTLLTEDAEYLILQTLSHKAARELIKNGINGPLLEEEVKMLCEEMGFHALALQLSIGFIKSQRISTAGGKGFGITDFLIHFDKNKKTFLDKTEKLTSYERNIFHHVRQFMILLEKRKENVAKELLLILSLFRHDGLELEFLLATFLANEEHKKPSNWFTFLELVGLLLSLFRNDLLDLGFIMEIISTVSNRNESTMANRADQLQKAMGLLHSFSLVDATSLNAITIHPLIQEATRSFLPSEWIAVADSVLGKIKIKTLFEKNLSHILRLWEIGSAEDSLLRKHAFLRMIDIYDRLYETSQIQLLIPFTHTYRANVFRVFGNAGTEMDEVLVAEIYYGMAHIEAGEYQKGLGILEASRESASQHLGNDHPSILSIEDQIACLLNRLGRSDEAVTIFQNILPRFISVFGEDDECTKKVKNNYALALSECGRSSEALQLYEEVFRWNLQNLGSAHQNTLRAVQNIACYHLEEGDLAKAKSEFKSVFELMRHTLGEKHPATLNARAWVATVFLVSGKYERAVSEYESLIQHSSEVLGPTHPVTLDNRQRHAQCLLKLGKKEEAITELKGLLELRTQKLGRQDPSVGWTRELLQSAQSGQFGQSIEFPPNEYATDLT